MIVQRLAAFLLIGVESAVLAYFSETVAFPLLVSAVALFGAVSTFRFRISQREWFYWNCSVGLAFFFKYLIAPHTFHLTATMTRTPLVYGVGQTVIVLQVIPFFLDWSLHRSTSRSNLTGTAAPDHTAGNRVCNASGAGRLPLRLPVLGVIALMCFADIRVTHQGRLMFQAMSIAFASCAAMFYGASRQLIHASVKRHSVRRHALHLVVLTVACSLSWIAATNLYRHERDIDQFLARFYGPVNGTDVIGFSGMSRLDSVSHHKCTNEGRIVLRIFSDHPPDYLRGKALDRLGRSEWFTSISSRILLSPSQIQFAGQNNSLRNEQIVSIRKDVILEQCREETYWPDATLAGHYFTPLGTAHLKTPVLDIFADANGIFSSQDKVPGRPYTALVCSNPAIESLSDAMRKRFLQLPEHLDGRVAALAKRLFAQCVTTEQKIDAVRSYFEKNYRYAFGISIPPHTDPLTYFLLEKPAAHCEYFASGAALLFRLGHVPCRYVTGFVVTEKNDFGNYWIARNRDAHAWVEAYDETGGWRIVETTPEAGMPSQSSPSELSQFIDYLRNQFQRFRFRLRRNGLKELVQDLLFLLVTPLVIGCAVTVALAWLFAAWWKSRSRRKRPADPILNEFHCLLHRMDARLKKQDLRRHTGETLTQFAQRIRTEKVASIDRGKMAQWYELYSSLRYNGQITEASVAKLKQSQITT